MDFREDDKSIDDKGGRSKCRHRRLTCDKGCVLRIKCSWGVPEKEGRVTANVLPAFIVEAAELKNA